MLIKFVAPKLLNLAKPETPRVDASMVIVDPCNPWALSATTWFDDEIKFYKLDDLDVDPKKDATFGKLENANLDPNLDCTVCKGKKIEKKNLYLKVSKVAACEHW